MARFRLFLLFGICSFCLFPSYGQEKTVILSGKVMGPDQQPLSGVNIRVKDSQQGTYSDVRGRFKLKTASGKSYVLIFSMLNYESVEHAVGPDAGKEIIQVMKPASVKLPEIEIQEQRKSSPGTVNIDPNLTRILSNTGSGAIEQLVKTLPGVSSRSELSPQYSVRGGNYDENLLYVNGIEIFRPFLVKTGEQEGLSFLNPDLVAAIRFPPADLRVRTATRCPRYWTLITRPLTNPPERLRPERWEPPPILKGAL